MQGPVALLQALSKATRMTGTETCVRGEPTENTVTLHFGAAEDMRRFFALASDILVNSRQPEPNTPQKPVGSLIDDLLAPLDGQSPPADWNPLAEEAKTGGCPQKPAA